MLLPSGKLDSSFAHNCLVSLWECFLVVDESVGIGLLTSVIKFLFGWFLGESIDDILSDSAREKNWLLLNDSHVGLVTDRVKRFQVLVTVSDISIIWVIESFNKLNDSRLSASTRAYEGHCLVFGNFDINLLDDFNVSLRGVVELNVLQ